MIELLTAKNNVERIWGVTEKKKKRDRQQGGMMTFFPFPAGNSRRRRRLKRTGATALVLTGAWRRQPLTSEPRYIPGHCLCARYQNVPITHA